MKKTAKQAASPDGSMSLSGHLKELRNRILVCVVLLVIVFALVLSVAPQIVTVLENMGRKYQYEFVQIAPQETFLVFMNVALIGAVVVSFPVFGYQIYAFCSPGLSRKERTYIAGSLVAGGLCFLLGVAFAYFISLPFMLRFLIQFNGIVDIAANISIQQYVSFLMTVFVIFGLVFELPVVSVLLTGLGIVRAEWLMKGRKVMIVVIFVLAAIITPPDIVSQVMVAIPMIALYEISIALSKLVGKARRAAAEAV